MSLLRFFKPLGQLPTADQTGLPAHAVTSANSAVKRALDGEDTDRARRKRKYTTIFTPEDRAKVGKYAAQNGVAKAQKNFRKLNLSESTVRYFKKAYLAEVSKRAKTGDATKVTHLEVAKRGRKVALGELLHGY